MRLHALLIVGLALYVAGCAEKKEPVAEPAAESQAPPATAPAPAPVEEQMAEERSAAAEDVRSAEFIDHMHAHAEQLDDLNFALADDDLEGAMAAAYWLSGHQEVGGIRDEWRPFLEGMREAAQDVEEASDLDTARAAAERINLQCQGCHDAAGVNQ